MKTYGITRLVTEYSVYHTMYTDFATVYRRNGNKHLVKAKNKADALLKAHKSTGFNINDLKVFEVL